MDVGSRCWWKPDRKEHGRHGRNGCRTVTYLLVPTKQNAHGLTSTLAAAPGMDLREARGLRGEVPRCARCARAAALRHALVAALVSQPSACRDHCRSHVTVAWKSTYMYFMSTSKASVPPGALYIRPNIGDMSAWRMDWRISMTVARWTSY